MDGHAMLASDALAGGPTVGLGSWSMAARYAAIGPTVDAVLAAAAPCIARAPAPEDTADALRLAVTEVLNNVIEHAYGGETPGLAGPSATLALAAGPNALAVSIVDRGIPMPPELVTLLAEDRLGADPVAEPGAGGTELPEGGWGWMLIRASVDRIAYAREGDENHLTLVKRTAPVAG